MLASKQYDIIIIGAGPVGLAFASSLKETDLSILLVEKSPLNALEDPNDDGREVALTYASIDILKELGAWDYLNKTLIYPIKRAQVFNGLNKTPLDFSADKSHLEALGYLVANYLIRQALFKVVKSLKNIDLLTQTTLETIKEQGKIKQLSLVNNDHQTISVKTKLLVAADSRMSQVRSQVNIPTQTHDFSKTMIVCRMQHANNHQSIAYEYFFYQKTLALLPLKKNTCSVIITVSKEKAESLMTLSELDFNTYVSTEFAHHLGKMNLIGKRYHYPLLGVLANRFITSGCALIGDAAVGMHPVTAHGFNLGLRGQAILANEIKQANIVNMNIASDFVLKKYQSRQITLSRLMYFGTNGIVSLFANDKPILKPVRHLMLKFAQKFPPIHYLITKHLTQSKQKQNQHSL